MPQPLEDAIKPLKGWWSRLSYKRKMMVLVGAVFGIGVVLASRGAYFDKAINATGPLCTTQTWSNRSSVPYPIEANPAGLVGQEVRDGKLAFTLTALDVCRADGQVRIHLKVKNTGSNALNFLPQNQLFLRYSDHPTGEVPKGGFACERCKGRGKELYINAGDSTETVVSFDIGREAPNIKAFEFHDSPLSMGVKVYP